jgi:hypothetical protein
LDLDLRRAPRAPPRYRQRLLGLVSTTTLRILQQVSESVVVAVAVS